MTVAVAVIVAVLKESILSNPLLSLNSYLFLLGLLATGLVGCGDPIDSELSFQEGGNEQSDFPSSASEGFNNGTSQSAESEGVSSDNILTFPSTENDSTEGGDPFNGNSSPGDENELPEFPEETEGSEAEEEIEPFEEQAESEEDEDKVEGSEESDFDYECTNGEEEECITSCGSIGTRICSKEWGPCVPPLEICNGVDDDCDGTADINAVDSVMWYPDLDNDGSGNGEQGEALCEPPSNWVDNGDDCNDEDSSLALDCSNPFDDYGLCGGYPLSTYKSGNASQFELNLLGVYEPISNGVIHVAVTRPTTMVLALSSYEPVEWNLQVSPDTTLISVLINGYHTQSVVGLPPGVPVEIRSHEQQSGNFGAACGYEYPYTNGGGCDTNALVTGLQQFTGLPLTSFAGCYQKSSFTLE